MYCPKCDQPMERIDADPSVGIMTGCWFCEACETSADLEDDESDHMDDEAREQ